MRCREKEARSVLAKINRGGETSAVDTYFELEELKESVCEESRCTQAFRELLKWKYLSRFDIYGSHR